MINDLFSILLAVLCFGSILFMAYVTTKFIGKKANAKINGKYMNVIESITLGIDKKICLIKVGSEFLLIAVSSKRIEFLCSVELEDYNSGKAEESGRVFSFKKLFDKNLDIYKNRRETPDGETKKSQDGSFRENLRRLQGVTKRFSSNGRENGDE